MKTEKTTAMDQSETAQTHFIHKIPIVFSVDDQYALYLSVTIQSIVETPIEVRVMKGGDTI